MLSLPDDLRGAFKEPLGPVFTGTDDLLAAADRAAADAGHARAPLVAVGDVVTFHLLEAGRTPDVALVDGKTEREAVDEAVERVVTSPDAVRVDNQPATLSRDLLTALRAALASPDPVTIHVDGEEDLAALPAVLALPDGGGVVYGQPGEGMVLVVADAESRERARDLFVRLDGDTDAALALLGG